MSKVRLCLVTFGVIIGVVGVLHGCAELLQGSALVKSNSIPACPENWPNPEFYKVMKGMPVFSILTGIPFYLLGILAILVSCALIVWSAFFMGTQGGLLVFGLLNVGVFLFGAGEGTPISMGIPLVIFGVLATKFPAKKHRSASTTKNLLFWFRFFFGLQIFSWILFCPGLVIVSSYGTIPQALFLFDFMSMPVSILGALICGFMYDRTEVVR